VPSSNEWDETLAKDTSVAARSGGPGEGRSASATGQAPHLRDVEGKLGSAGSASL